MVFEHGEDAIEEIEHTQDLGDVLRGERAGVGGRVGRAHHLRDGRRSLGGVEVVGQRGRKLLRGLLRRCRHLSVRRRVGESAAQHSLMEGAQAVNRIRRCA